MDELDTTVDALPVETGSETASNEPGMTLSELNAALGKTFPNKETALKALKDTQVWAVTREEKIAEKVRSSIVTPDTSGLTQELAQIKEALFYKDNPEYVDYKGTIKALGQNPAEVIESEAFKAIYADAKAGKEFKNTRTVLESNPRIAEAKNTFDKAAEMQKLGRTAETAQLAASAVIDALGIK
jgi:hypothetical protein